MGDAAGQCLPFTGEGIRPALYFGAVASTLARRALDGELSIFEALRAYRKADTRHLVITHRILLAAQQIIPGLPMGWMERIAVFFLRPEILDPVFQAYRAVINPDVLSQMWSRQPSSPTSFPVKQAQSDLGSLAGRVP